MLRAAAGKGVGSGVRGGTETGAGSVVTGLTSEPKAAVGSGASDGLVAFFSGDFSGGAGGTRWSMGGTLTFLTSFAAGSGWLGFSTGFAGVATGLAATVAMGLAGLSGAFA